MGFCIFWWVFFFQFFYSFYNHEWYHLLLYYWPKYLLRSSPIDLVLKNMSKKISFKKKQTDSSCFICEEGYLLFNFVNTKLSQGDDISCMYYVSIEDVFLSSFNFQITFKQFLSSVSQEYQIYIHVWA